MANQKAKDLVILVDTVPTTSETDISTFVNDSTWTGAGGTQDMTTYGSDDEVHEGTLKGGGFRMGGKYSTNATGTPQTLFDGHETETFAIKRRPQGTGSGKPQQSFQGVLTQYEESAPVAGYIMWTAQFTRTGPVDRTAQTP